MQYRTVLGCPGGPCDPGDPCDSSGTVSQVIHAVRLIWVIRVVAWSGWSRWSRWSRLSQWLGSSAQMILHPENMWFLWSKPSNNQDKLRYHARDGRTDGGKWKIVQCFGRPETATIIAKNACLDSTSRASNPKQFCMISFYIQISCDSCIRLYNLKHQTNIIGISGLQKPNFQI